VGGTRSGERDGCCGLRFAGREGDLDNSSSKSERFFCSDSDLGGEGVGARRTAFSFTFSFFSCFLLGAESDLEREPFRRLRERERLFLLSLPRDLLLRRALSRDELERGIVHLQSASAHGAHAAPLALEAAS